MGEGRHYDTYEKLGAHVKTVDGISGVHFAVWAPSARRVSVVGDFNRWDGRVHPMRARGSSGIWELFIPELGEGAIYKFEIVGPQDTILPLKADPYAFASELRPNTGSVVARLDKHHWNDAEWMNQRSHKNLAGAADLRVRSASRLLAPHRRREQSLAQLTANWQINSSPM